MRLGLAFPCQIVSSTEEILARVSAGIEFSVLEWTCRPSKRGQYFIDGYFLETTSRLGFWMYREGRETACELRVYPNFLSERKQVAALFLNRGHLGIHAHRQAGKGRDFEKLREYIPGDSYDEIHWKASAKRGRPVTKVFQVERTQEVYVVLDASRLMARDASVFERCIASALLLGVAAEQQGDSFGMIAFSDRVIHFARARSGKAQFDVCRDMLYALEPQSVTPDFDELASFIRTRLRKRALLVFLTALDDPAIGEGFLHAIDLICRQHLILVNMLRPATAQPLFSDAAVANIDEIYGRLGGHLLWHDLREAGQGAATAGCALFHAGEGDAIRAACDPVYERQSDAIDMIIDLSRFLDTGRPAWSESNQSSTRIESDPGHTKTFDELRRFLPPLPAGFGGSRQDPDVCQRTGDPPLSRIADGAGVLRD